MLALLSTAAPLFAGKFDDVSALVVHFKKLPSVMTVGAFLPQYDYNAKPVQLIHDITTIAQLVSFNILAASNHAAVVMLWFREHSLVKAFAESFIGQDSARYATLAIQTAFEYLENTCMQAKWWEAQKQIVRNLLIDRMQGSVLEQRASNSLTFCGVGFDEWEYERHQFVNVT
jgi:hypothetical protein